MCFHSIYLRMTKVYILYEHQNLQEEQDTVNLELVKLCYWLRTNKLSLNVKKSNYLIFRPRQKPLSFTPVFNLPDNLNIFKKPEQKDFIKYLGVFIDSDLSWK